MPRGDYPGLGAVFGNQTATTFAEMNATEDAAALAIASVARLNVSGLESETVLGQIPGQVPGPAVGAKDVGEGRSQRTGRSLWNYIITVDVITTKAINDDHGGIQDGVPDDDHGGDDHGGGPDYNHAGSHHDGGPDDNR